MMPSRSSLVYHHFIGYNIILHTIFRLHLDTMLRLTGTLELTGKTYIMNKLIMILLGLALFNPITSCNSSLTKNCEINEVKTLFTIAGIHDKDTSYAHYTLIKDFSRECMDSATMVNLALKYSDTV